MDNAQKMQPLSDYSLLNIIDAAVNGIIVLDKFQTVIIWNDWMSKCSGIPSEEAVGKTLLQLFPEQKNKRLDKATLGAVNDGTSTLLSQALNRFPLPLKNNHTGEVIQQMIYINPINTGSDARYCLIQVNDVSAAIKREQQLRLASIDAQQARKQAEKLSDLKSGFVSTVSHELRTPLTSIMGSLGIIDSETLGKLPDKIKDLVKIAHKNTQRLLLLINDILDIEKIESGRMEINLKKVNVADLVRHAIEANEGYARKYNVSYQLNKAETGLFIDADFDRLIQVMNNLMSNAAKFSPNGEIIEINYYRHDDMVRISVHDRGTGIPEEYHASIFEKFTQADMSDSRHKGGTGLGLNISKAIVEMHNGTINFQSSPGKGTVFFIEIPAQ